MAIANLFKISRLYFHEMKRKSYPWLNIALINSIAFTKYSKVSAQWSDICKHSPTIFKYRLISVGNDRAICVCIKMWTSYTSSPIVRVSLFLSLHSNGHIIIPHLNHEAQWWSQTAKQIIFVLLVLFIHNETWQLKTNSAKGFINLHFD